MRPFPACPALRKSHPSHVSRPAGSGSSAELPRAPHSPRVALGSRTVNVLLLPAWGILTRFHGSALRRSAAAILRGAIGPGKTEPGEPGLSGLGGTGREGGSGGAGPGAESRPLRPSREGDPGALKFLPDVWSYFQARCFLDGSD